MALFAKFRQPGTPPCRRAEPRKNEASNDKFDGATVLDPRTGYSAHTSRKFGGVI